MRTYNREASVVFSDLYHLRVDNLLLSLGKDKFYSGWNGEMKYVKFNVGNGAFVSSDFN